MPLHYGVYEEIHAQKHEIEGSPEYQDKEIH